jgi:predicted glycoside hydrolase/deacetylase ChbG (UPF0249 family)
MPARLILNADDFGLTLGINRAVEQLHRAGCLTSATLMPTGPAFDDAVQIAKRNPTLGVGCHLTFVDGIPVSHPESIPTLLGSDGKTFRSSNLDFLQALLRNTIAPADIARETQAQIQHLQRAGIDVTHIDSHKHTHLFPAIARPALDIAQRCGVRAFRYPAEPVWSRTLATNVPMQRRLAMFALDLFEPSFRRLVQLDADEVTTQGTLGIASTGTLTAQSLRQLLAALRTRPPQPTTAEPRVYELCTHPGYNDADLAHQNTRLRQSRETELHALLEVFAEDSCTPEPIPLIHYGDLGIPGHQRRTHQYTQPTGHERIL